MASGNEVDLHVLETTGSTHQLQIKWIFRNATFKWGSKAVGEKMTSPLYHAKEDEEVKWCLNFYPNGVQDDDKGYISAYICLKSSPAKRSPHFGRLSSSLFDEESKKILWQSGASSQIFSIDSPVWGWRKFAKHSDLFQSKVFSLTCKLEYEDSKTTTTSSSIPSMQSSNEEANSSLDRDLEQFFTNRLGTDVCFIIDGKEIKAHKMILSARSPVFAAMLLSGMKESAESRVEIDDIAPHIFEALLRFIYTDRVDFTNIDPKDLLAAANKYLLPLLKFECQKILVERIKKENCVELLALADLHNAVHLKKSALNFVRRHRAEIVLTEGWKDLKQSRPDFAFVFDVVDSLI